MGQAPEIGYGTRVVLDRSISSVWAQLADPANLARWSPAWRDARITTPGPIRVGTTFEGRRSIARLPLAWSGVITEWDPPRTIAYVVDVLGARSQTRIELEPSGSGTAVALMGEREPRRLQVLAWRVLGPLLRRHHRGRLEALRRALDA